MTINNSTPIIDYPLPTILICLGLISLINDGLTIFNCLSIGTGVIFLLMSLREVKNKRL